MRRAHLQINDISVSCGTFKATDRTKTGINNRTGNPAGNHYTHTYRTRTPPTGLWHCEERGCGWSVHMVRVWHLLPLRVPINHTRQITFRQQRVVLACDVRSICVDTSGLGRQRAQRTVSERGGPRLEDGVQRGPRGSRTLPPPPFSHSRRREGVVAHPLQQRGGS